MLVYFFTPLIYIAKYLVTGRNPLEKERGMDFFIDVIDWLGGYPYEYATSDEIIHYIKKRGFEILKIKKGKTPIACNEFLFQKMLDPAYGGRLASRSGYGDYWILVKPKKQAGLVFQFCPGRAGYF